MGTLLGFVAGYVFGAKYGRDGQVRLRQAVDTIVGSTEFKSLVSRGLALFDLAGAARDGTAGSNGPGEEGRAPLARDDRQLRASWRDIADSETFQLMVATGLSLAGDLFERGKALVEDRLAGPGAGRGAA